MTLDLGWERDGRDWPNRENSCFVEAGGLRWHVQQAGRGPTLLLLHGTGASTHSWRDLLPLLAGRFSLVAPDLPGHGFTTPLPEMSLPAVAASLGALLQRLDVQPEIIAGHSAGAAIAVRMTLDGIAYPQGIVSINGALLPLRGFAGDWFSPLAKLLVGMPLVRSMFAWRGGQQGVVERLLRSTGSRIDAHGVELYRRLVASPNHVGAALDMMANWDLRTLQHDLQRLAVPLLLIVGDRDGTIPPAEAAHVQRLVAHADIVSLPRLGHLAHEEASEKVADVLSRFAASVAQRAA